MFLNYLTSLTLFLLCVLPVSADEEVDFYSLSLKELSQVTVTIASRIEEKSLNSPSSVSVITRVEIERLGVKTLSELINYVPGFQSYMSPHDSNRSLYVVRGLSSVYGSNLLLMIDGHRINDEYTGGFTFADHLLGLSNVKQVEFIRGPGSALYGSNAFSGVINIITDPERSNAAVTIGNNNTRAITAATYGSLGKLQTSASFNYYRNNGQFYDDLTDKNGFNKSSSDPSEVFEARIDLNYQRTQMILEYLNTKLSDYYVFRRINNNVNKNNTQRIGVYLEHEFSMPDRWQAHGRIGTMRHERQQTLYLTPSSSNIFTDDWRQDTHEAQIDLNYLTLNDHQLSIGSYIGMMNIPIANFNTSGRYVLDKTRKTVGLYAQDQFDIINDVRLTAGLRYDDYSDFGNSLNPRLTVQYLWRKNESFKFMYGRAYRAPSLGDLYDKENIFNTKSPDLDPITVDSYEIAYLYSKNNNSVVITGFYNDHKNFIALLTDSMGGNLYDNIYDNQITGLELEVTWKFDQKWSTRVAVTHIISNNTDAPPRTNFTPQDQLTPSSYGNVQLNYFFQKWNWNISTIGHNGISILQDEGSLFIFNTRLHYKINSQWKIAATIQNLLDKTYSTPQNLSIGTNQSGNSIQELPSKGRELFLTLQYNFN